MPSAANRPHRDKDQEIFLQGIDAFRQGLPRRAPANLPTGPDSDAALWLAGYSAERDEWRLLRKHGHNPLDCI